MSFKLKRQALTLFSNTMAPKSTNRHNAKEWLKAVQYLGPNWILSNPIQIQKQQ